MGNKKIPIKNFSEKGYLNLNPSPMYYGMAEKATTQFFNKFIWKEMASMPKSDEMLLELVISLTLVSLVTRNLALKLIDEEVE